MQLGVSRALFDDDSEEAGKSFCAIMRLTAMSENRPELTRSDLLEEPSAVESFLHAAAYTGLQEPVSGAAQLFDKVAGTDVLPHVQLIEAPQEDSFAGMLGSITAKASHLGLMIAAGHKIGGPLNNLQSFAGRMGICGAMGSLYGGVLTPVANDQNFWDTRLRNTVTGGLGMAAASGAMSVYGDVIGKGMTFMDYPPYGMLKAALPISMSASVESMLSDNDSSPVYMPGRMQGLESLLPYKKN